MWSNNLWREPWDATRREERRCSYSKKNTHPKYCGKRCFVDERGCSAVSARTVAEMSRDRIMQLEALSVSSNKADQRPAFVLGQPA